MNLFTHLGIAIKLKHIIEANLCIRLNTLSFLFGNIKPDISFRYWKIPHYKKDSEGFIREEIQNILENRVYEFGRCSGEFSRDLGVITHYLSDYFCYAHSEHFTSSILDHHIYEMKLFIYNKRNSRKILENATNTSYLEVYESVSSIWNYIDDLREKYLDVCKEDKLSTDMKYTLKACTALCISVITACMAGNENFTNIPEEVLL